MGAPTPETVVLNFFCVKTKESGPLGGMPDARPLDLPMTIKLFFDNTAVHNL